MKKKIRMFYYILRSKLKYAKKFISEKKKKFDESPFAFLYSLGGILIIFFIIYGIISLASGNDDSNNYIITTSAGTSAIEAMITTTQEETTIPETTTAEEETTTIAEEETTKPQLIDVSKIEVSDKDLSEPVNKNNAFSNSDAPSYTNNATPVTFYPSNYTSVLYGIDVSKWQGNINWSKVAAAGYKFAFIKVGGRGTGTGSLYYDDAYKRNIEGAIAAGLDVGVYFFSQAITEREALEEASLIVNAIKNYNITYPVVFDWETGYHSNGSPYRSNGAKLSNSAMTKVVNSFINAVESSGYEAMVYGNAYDLSLFDINSVSKSHKVWYARYWSYYRNYDNYYIPGKDTPVTSFPYQIWQYKDTGIVPGIPEKVDMNVLFLSNSINISVKKDNVHIAKNTVYDPLSNITAKDSMSKDVSKYVTYTITNSSGANISLANALKNTGTYIITYSAQYLNETSNTPTVKLTVTDIPSISLKANEITMFNYCDNGISTNEIAMEISNVIYHNISKAVDFTNKDISSSLNIKLPSPMFVLDDLGNPVLDFKDTESLGNLPGLTLFPGKHTIYYTVKDQYDNSCTKQFLVCISNLLEDSLSFEIDNIDDNFSETLNNTLLTNISPYSENISIVYDNELTEKLDELANGNNTFANGDTFTVTYIITNGNIGTLERNCTISFTSTQDTQEETTTIDNQ